MRDDEETSSGGQFGRRVRVEKVACGPMQEMLERNDSRLRSLVRQRIAGSKACCTVVDEQRISISLHGSTDLCFRDDVIRSHLFPEETRSLAKLSLV